MGNPYNSGSKKGLIDSSISKCPIHSFCLSRLFLLRLPLCHRLAEIRVVSKKTGFEDTFQSDTSASALGLSNSKRRHVADSSVEAALKVFRKLVGVRSSRTWVSFRQLTKSHSVQLTKSRREIKKGSFRSLFQNFLSNICEKALKEWQSETSLRAETAWCRKNTGLQKK